MRYLRQVAFALVAALSALFLGTATASATVVPADWFSNTTSVLNVVDPPGPTGPERLRLAGGFTSGFVEGTVTLPFVADWIIFAEIQTDGQANLPAEFVKIFIDDFTPGNEVAQIFNTPLNTLHPFSHGITGDSFSYRFEFESPSTDFGSHLIVERGTVTARVPEPGTLALLAVGLAVLGLVRRRRAAA